jgi:hypothetical protein
VIEVYDNKLYLAVEASWEDYCKNRLGISRRTAERLIRNYKQYGPNLARLNCFARIKPGEYRLFAAVLTDDGLLYNGETIPLEPENTPRLAQVVEAIREQSAGPEPEPLDPAARAFAKAEKSLQNALAEFSKIQAMKLDDEGRLKLLIAVETGRNHLDRFMLTVA